MTVTSDVQRGCVVKVFLPLIANNAIPMPDKIGHDIPMAGDGLMGAQMTAKQRQEILLVLYIFAYIMNIWIADNGYHTGIGAGVADTLYDFLARTRHQRYSWD